ncbi:hypothetical protein MTR67_049048 [Solanum verrucosum]|uniref:Uncharacterized protein n=1 Tax=Solanum verrucosum TaxID=315347 RepID=A0AAF0V2P3_SOLVR|nr:hypothetical protein MTR67_049048 [Solanum verrucosum]
MVLVLREMPARRVRPASRPIPFRPRYVESSCAICTEVFPASTADRRHTVTGGSGATPEEKEEENSELIGKRKRRRLMTQGTLNDVVLVI